MKKLILGIIAALMFVGCGEYRETNIPVYAEKGDERVVIQGDYTMLQVYTWKPGFKNYYWQTVRVVYTPGLNLESFLETK